MQSIDVRYLLELRFEEDLASIARALMAEDDVSESIVALLMTRLAWTYLSGAELQSWCISSSSVAEAGST